MSEHWTYTRLWPEDAEFTACAISTAWHDEKPVVVKVLGGAGSPLNALGEGRVDYLLRVQVDRETVLEVPISAIPEESRERVVRAIANAVWPQTRSLGAS